MVLTAQWSSLQDSSFSNVPTGHISPPVSVNVRTGQIWRDPMDLACPASADRLPLPRRVIVCVMVSTAYQSRVLRTFLHESMPYADDLVMAEFPIGFDNHTSAKSELDAILAEPPFKKFTARVHVFRPALSEVLRTVQKLTNGHKTIGKWVIEEHFRCEFHSFLKALPEAHRLNVGDVIVSNLDLDEVIHRSTLLAWKHCRNVPVTYGYIASFHIQNKRPRFHQEIQDVVNYYLQISQFGKQNKKIEKFINGHEFVLSPTANNERALVARFAELKIDLSVMRSFPLLVAQYKHSLQCMAKPNLSQIRGVVFQYVDEEDLKMRYAFKMRGNVHYRRGIRQYNKRMLDVVPSTMLYLQGLTIHLCNFFTEAEFAIKVAHVSHSIGINQFRAERCSCFLGSLTNRMDVVPSVHPLMRLLQSPLEMTANMSEVCRPIRQSEKAFSPFQEAVSFF